MSRARHHVTVCCLVARTGPVGPITITLITIDPAPAATKHWTIEEIHN